MMCRANASVRPRGRLDGCLNADLTKSTHEEIAPSTLAATTQRCGLTTSAEFLRALLARPLSSADSVAWSARDLRAIELTRVRGFRSFRGSVGARRPEDLRPWRAEESRVRAFGNIGYGVWRDAGVTKRRLAAVAGGVRVPNHT